jgi:hypothetical protein
LMTGSLEQACEPFPTPGAVAAPVDQAERGHAATLNQGVRHHKPPDVMANLTW